MRMCEVMSWGAKCFLDAVEAEDVAEELSKMKSSEVYALSEYLDGLGHSGAFVGVLKSMTLIEKGERFDQEVKDALKILVDPIGNTVAEGMDIEDLPAGGTVAEGMDAAMGGENL